MIPAERITFIPWSGGLDSTYLIWLYLKAGLRVVAGSIGILNNPEQTEAEKTARHNLWPFGIALTR